MLGLRPPGLEFRILCLECQLSSQSSHHPQEALLAQFSLYVHKGGLKPDSFHFHFCVRITSFSSFFVSQMNSSVFIAFSYFSVLLFGCFASPHSCSAAFLFHKEGSRKQQNCEKTIFFAVLLCCIPPPDLSYFMYYNSIAGGAINCTKHVLCGVHSSFRTCVVFHFRCFYFRPFVATAERIRLEKTNTILNNESSNQPTKVIDSVNHKSM